MTHASEDREAIRELLARYCYLLDAYRLDEFADLFIDDGEWVSPAGHATGPGAIERLLRGLMPMPADGGPRKHFTDNIIIVLSGDAAAVTSNYLCVRGTFAGPAISSVGTYEDIVVRMAAGWKFKSRRLSHDIVGNMGLNQQPRA